MASDGGVIREGGIVEMTIWYVNFHMLFMGISIHLLSSHVHGKLNRENIGYTLPLKFSNDQIP